MAVRIVLAVLVLAHFPVLRAQDAASPSSQICEIGVLRVLVQDVVGKPISEVQIRLGAESATGKILTTNANGIAEFADVTCGAWVLKAAKNGFQEPPESSVQITSRAVVELTLTLTPQAHDSVDVHETVSAVEQNSSAKQDLHPNDVKNLPMRPATVADALPLVPGVVRSPDGELKIAGTAEHRSAFVVNQTDVTDPATGKFGQTVPIDSVETVSVLNSSFLAQYGRFTSGVVAVETRRGGEKWHSELNDPLPDFRFRSAHMRGIRDSTPRGVLGGPLINERLYLMTTLQYDLLKKPDRTLAFPFNESKQESVNSFTQLDYILSANQILNGTFHLSPQHTNFVKPDYFNPEPVTPSYAQHNYVGSIGDHLSIYGGVLDSTLSIQRFDAAVGAQGTAEMIVEPMGNRGNYFGSQNREAGRTEWLEGWSPAQKEFKGAHALKFGSTMTFLSDRGEFWARPINLLDIDGVLLRRIDFSGGSSYNRTDMEIAAFAQDHWSLNSKTAVDYGMRVEHQDATGAFKIAPRAGFAWTPFSGEHTVLRAGYGQFYDRVPLGVFTFVHYPQRTVTDYAPDGSILGDPTQYQNVLGIASGPASPLIDTTRHRAGNFTPRSANWNVQLEQSVSRLLRLRASYSNSRSAGLVVLEPTDALQLTGGGRSMYRQAEVTARVAWQKGQFALSYTRSRAQGSLNEFSGYLGNFPTPLVRPDVFTNLPGDLPNRFLGWGRLNLPSGVQILPMVEFRNGFPYASLDALGNYVGTPNGDRSRFPNFFSADARILKDIKVNPNYTLRFSLSGFNLSNHFNALLVHANIADPQYGVFFGNYHVRYRADFDVLF